MRILVYFTETKDRIQFNNWDKWKQGLEFHWDILCFDLPIISLFSIHTEDHFPSIQKDWLDSLDPKFKLSTKRLKLIQFGYGFHLWPN